MPRNTGSPENSMLSDDGAYQKFPPTVPQLKLPKQNRVRGGSEPEPHEPVDGRGTAGKAKPASPSSSKSDAAALAMTISNLQSQVAALTSQLQNLAGQADVGMGRPQMEQPRTEWSPRLAGGSRSERAGSPPRSDSAAGVAQSPSEEDLLTWYRSQRPAHSVTKEYRFQAAAREVDRANRTVAKSPGRGLLQRATGSRAGAISPRATSPRPRSDSNTSFGSGMPAKSSLWQLLRDRLKLQGDDFTSSVSGRSVRTNNTDLYGDLYEPYQAQPNISTLYFKTPHPGAHALAGVRGHNGAHAFAAGAAGRVSPRHSSPRRLDPHWARPISPIRSESSTVSLSTLPPGAPSVRFLASQMCARILQDFGALEVAAAYAAIVLGLCTEQQLEEYLGDNIGCSGPLSPRGDGGVFGNLEGDRATVLRGSDTLTAIRTALPVVKFTVAEFEEVSLEILRCCDNRKDVRRIFHLLDSEHGSRLGTVDLRHLSEYHPDVFVDEPQLSPRDPLQSWKPLPEDLSPRMLSPEEKEQSFKEARQRRKSRKSEISLSPPRDPMHGDGLHHHCHSTFSNNLRNHDAMPPVRSPSPRRRREGRSPSPPPPPPPPPVVETDSVTNAGSSDEPLHEPPSGLPGAAPWIAGVRTGDVAAVNQSPEARAAVAAGDPETDPETPMLAPTTSSQSLGSQNPHETITSKSSVTTTATTSAMPSAGNSLSPSAVVTAVPSASNLSVPAEARVSDTRSPSASGTATPVVSQETQEVSSKEALRAHFGNISSGPFPQAGQKGTPSSVGGAQNAGSSNPVKDWNMLRTLQHSGLLKGAQAEKASSSVVPSTGMAGGYRNASPVASIPNSAASAITQSFGGGPLPGVQSRAGVSAGPAAGMPAGKFGAGPGQQYPGAPMRQHMRPF